MYDGYLECKNHLYLVLKPKKVFRGVARDKGLGENQKHTTLECLQRHWILSSTACSISPSHSSARLYKTACTVSSPAFNASMGANPSHFNDNLVPGAHLSEVLIVGRIRNEHKKNGREER